MAVPVPVILDTDIGPDCDDAGALAVLHALADGGEADIVGVMHCTSSPWGAGCIDAINAYCGRPHLPVGTLREPGFLESHPNSLYNEYIASRFPNRYREAVAPEASELYRELLAGAADGSVVLIAIGPLANVHRLLLSPPDRWSEHDGRELARRKVKELVVMGGQYPAGREWNFEMHPASAQAVAAKWPTPIVFSGYEIGADVRTGSRLGSTPAGNPVRVAYERFLRGEPTRPSWDLTAVLYGVRGCGEWWDLSERGTVDVDVGSGDNRWTPDPAGRHRYLMRRAEPAAVAAALDDLLDRALSGR